MTTAPSMNDHIIEPEASTHLSSPLQAHPDVI